MTPEKHEVVPVDLEVFWEAEDYTVAEWRSVTAAWPEIATLIVNGYVRELGVADDSDAAIAKVRNLIAKYGKEEKETWQSFLDEIYLLTPEAFGKLVESLV